MMSKLVCFVKFLLSIGILIILLIVFNMHFYFMLTYGSSNIYMSCIFLKSFLYILQFFQHKGGNIYLMLQTFVYTLHFSSNIDHLQSPFKNINTTIVLFKFAFVVVLCCFCNLFE